MTTVALRLGAMVALLLGWARPAAALTVAVVRPPSAPTGVAELAVRLRGELLSVGLEVETADRPPSGEPSPGARPAWLDDLTAARHVDAVIEVVPSPGAPVVVWIVGKPPHAFTSTKVAVAPAGPNASEQIAIRAIEVLRASFTELDWAMRERARSSTTMPTTTAAPLAVTATAIPPERQRFALAAGGVVSGGLDGAGTALLPMVGAGVDLHERFAVQVVLAGLGSRPTITAPAGSARVSQAFGVVGGCLRLSTARDLRPFVALAAGALHTTVEGRAESPWQGHSEARWSLLLDGSLGSEWRLGGRYVLTLAAHVQLAEPYVAIHVGDTTAATAGRPALLVSLALGAWL